MTQVETLEGADGSRAPAAPSISVRGLTKRFGAVIAVDDLTFDVLPGGVTGFLGQNGAGKSTTLRVLLDLARPTGGTATIEGVRYTDLTDPLHTVGAVLETQSFLPLRTGRNHLRVIADAAGIGKDRVDEVLELVDLRDAADRKAGKYSLGMRQRLSLAGALLGDPRILVLDEPANGLDPQGIRWLREFLQAFAAGGRAVLVSPHQLGEIEQMADDVVVIHHGRLIRHAPVAQLTSVGSTYRVGSPRSTELAEVLRGAGMQILDATGEHLVVGGGSGRAIGTAAFDAGIPLFELAEDQASLEDVFIEMTGTETGS